MRVLAKNASEIFEITRLPVYIAHTPAGTSVQNMVHYCQGMWHDRFEALDFGSASANLAKYNRTTPPPYGLTASALNLPTRVYWGGMDRLATSHDVERILRELTLDPRVDDVSDVYLEDYNHLDFVWGLDAHHLQGKCDDSAEKAEEGHKIKRLFLAALESCSIKDAEVTKLRQNMHRLIEEIEDHSRILTAQCRKNANSKITELLEYQQNLEQERLILKMRNERMAGELMRLREICDICLNKGFLKMRGDFRSSISRCDRNSLSNTMQHKLESQKAETELENMKQKLAMKIMELESYQERFNQLQTHSNRQEVQLEARTAELETLRRRENELTRSFAERIQALEMMLNSSRCAFSRREKELMRRLKFLDSARQHS
ncbi:hypothetical protein Aperf_G00000016926 [Anoplocephala perfoliata]